MRSNFVKLAASSVSNGTNRLGNCIVMAGIIVGLAENWVFMPIPCVSSLKPAHFPSELFPIALERRPLMLDI